MIKYFYYNKDIMLGMSNNKAHSFFYGGKEMIKIIEMKTGEKFESFIQVEKRFNINANSLKKKLQNNNVIYMKNYIFTTPNTLSSILKDEVIDDSNDKIIEIYSGRIFNSINEVSEYYNESYYFISKIIKQKQDKSFIFGKDKISVKFKLMNNEDISKILSTRIIIEELNDKQNRSLLTIEEAAEKYNISSFLIEESLNGDRMIETKDFYIRLQSGIEMLSNSDIQEKEIDETENIEEITVELVDNQVDEHEMYFTNKGGIVLIKDNAITKINTIQDFINKFNNNTVKFDKENEKLINIK